MADEAFDAEPSMSTPQRGRPPKLSEDEISEIKLSTVLSNAELARLLSYQRGSCVAHSLRRICTFCAKSKSTKSITWIYVRGSVIRV